MKDITVRNPATQPQTTHDPARPLFEPWGPTRALRALMGWDPFQDMSALRPLSNDAFMPAFDVKEHGDALVFRADVPGVAEKDLEVSVSGNRLTVAGKRESEKRSDGEQGHLYERTFGSFSRTFTLPEWCNVDGIHAQLSDGVLTLHVPKMEVSAPRRIDVNKAPSAKA